MTESHTPAPKAIEALPENIHSLPAAGYLWTDKHGFTHRTDCFPDLAQVRDGSPVEPLLTMSAVSAALAAAQAEQAKPDRAMLLKFYDVTSTSDLIDAQARHIEKLQSMLPYPQFSFAPRTVREG